MNTGHCITNNDVKHITSYFPGAVCENKRDPTNNKLILESENLLISGKLHKNCRTVRRCLNICGDGTLDINGNPINLSEIDDPDKIKEYLNPHVFGIADIRMCSRNNFTPWFQQLETTKDLNEILPLFVSDTIVLGNKVKNAINYWNRICNNYEFYFLNKSGINADGTLTDRNLTSSDLFLENCNPETDQDAFEAVLNYINVIKDQLLKEKNDGLFWTRDINVNNLECQILKLTCEKIECKLEEKMIECELLHSATKDKINYSFCNSIQSIHKDGIINITDEFALRYLPLSQRISQCIQQKAYLLLSTECNEDELNAGIIWCDFIHIPDKHAEIEAINADLDEIEESDSDCFDDDLNLI